MAGLEPETRASSSTAAARTVLSSMTVPEVFDLVIHIRSHAASPIGPARAADNVRSGSRASRSSFSAPRSRAGGVDRHAKSPLVHLTANRSFWEGQRLNVEIACLDSLLADLCHNGLLPMGSPPI